VLDGAKRIIELYENDEFKPFIVEGDHGFGKSTYANRLIAEVYSDPDLGWEGNGETGNWSKDLFRSHMGFHPREVIQKWRAKRSKDYVFHWDDAGLWLHSLDFQNRFVKNAGKYMQVVRNDWACVIFSAISREDITSKIRGMRNAIIIEITKHESIPDSSEPARRNRRTARAYIERKTWKGKTWKDYQWEERFNSHVPGQYVTDRHGKILKQSGFYGWYKPLRDHYSDIAKELMKKSVEEDTDFDIPDIDQI
jgi:hypothetical protein